MKYSTLFGVSETKNYPEFFGHSCLCNERTLSRSTKTKKLQISMTSYDEAAQLKKKK